MKKKLLMLSLFAISSTFAEEVQINPNIGHLRHHHHGEKFETVPAQGGRFETSRTSQRQLQLPMEKESFTFAIFGDRTGGPVNGVAVLADAVRDVNLLQPDLVMTVGDLVQGYNQKEKWLEEKDEYLEIMNHLTMPWFPVAGNHDVYWRGPEGEAPKGGHASEYEVHMGPLWYAFEHKNCWFIVLYADEGDPQTGEQLYQKPEAQKMSPEQFAWLEQTLGKAKSANHVFIFLHHPRWMEGNYGEDWRRVHQLLKNAGNVSAVFAGHIHRMHYTGVIDGIEYLTLATTGGAQSGLIPSMGDRHHINLVTVREGRYSMAALPVGSVMDVREITPQLIEEGKKLVALPLRSSKPIDLRRNGDNNGTFSMKIENPTAYPIEIALEPSSKDARWSFQPKSQNFHLKPGETQEMSFSYQRRAATLDEDLDLPVMRADIRLLAKGANYDIPTREENLAVVFPVNPDGKQENLALDLNGENEYLPVPSERLQIDHAFTLETWFQARRFDQRTGLVSKAEGSEYGLFVDQGHAKFIVHVGGKYLSAVSETPVLETGKWHHMAGVFDGKEVRLYLDGKLVAKTEGQGDRKRNRLPLVIGADVSKSDGAVNHFAGLIDEVRLSQGARYQGEHFEPARRQPADEKTALLYHFSERIGPWFPDESGSLAHSVAVGRPQLVPVK